VQRVHLVDQPAEQIGRQVAVAAGRRDHRLHQAVFGGLVAPDDGADPAPEHVEELGLPERAHHEHCAGALAAREPAQPGEGGVVEGVADEQGHRARHGLGVLP
jgi:hypothetical protein